MRRSLDPHASGLSLLALSLTSLLLNIFPLFRVTAFAQAVCSTPSFRTLEQKIEPQSRYSTDPVAPSLAVGDFNQDGLPDLVVSPAVASEVPLLTNLGNGTFRAGYFLDLPYRDAVIADFNNDGRADIVALTIYETVTTLLGESNGSFSALNSSGGGQATVVGRYSTALRAGDFNRDGLLDIAVVNTISNSISILVGKGNGNFLDPVNYHVQENPHSLVVADFTGDGVPDVVTANEYSETVTLLTNDGSGGFAASHFPAGALPQKVVAWDFNRDGKRDLAIVNRGYNSVTVLGNDGAGNFAFVARWDLQSLGSTLAAGDFNGDGKDDVAVGHPFDGALTLFLGDGNGGFCAQVPKQLAVAGCCPVMDVAAADFNRDGTLDLLVAREDVVTVLLNGNVTPPPNTAPTITGQANVMAAGTLPLTANLATVSDAETPAGSLQVEVTAAPPGVTINNIVNLNGAIRATFTLSCQAAVGNQTIGLKVTDAGGLSASTTANLLIAANSGPTLGGYAEVTLNAATTTVTPSRSPADNGTITSLTVAAQGYGGQLTIDPQGVVTIANNGVAGRYLAVITATDNCGASGLIGFNFTIPSTPQACETISFKPVLNLQAGTGPQSLLTSDLNGDGVLDFVTTNQGSNQVSILLGANVSGTPSLQSALQYAVGYDLRAITGHDFDGDGKLDLAAVSRATDTVTILRGNGDGSFVPGGSFACGNKPLSVAVGDFNRDGKADLVIVNEGLGNLALLDGNGDGSFQAPRYFGAGSSPQPAQVGDFNKDGISDVVVANFQTNQITVLLGNGAGGFQTPRAFNTGTGWEPSPIAVGDLNKDGNLDLLVGKTGSAHVAVMIGGGNGNFGFYTAFVTGREPQSMAIADLDGDGDQDVAVGNAQANSVTVFPGTGNGFYSTLSGVYYNVGARPLSLRSGDFNGDGKPDLAIANSGGGTISLLLNGCGK